MSNTEILSAVHGIAPRSDALHRLGTDLERGRISEQGFDDVQAQETADWLALQADAEIDIPENGKLAWQDHLRAIVASSEGFAAAADEAPVTRWVDSNTFYRQPTIIDKLQFNPDCFQQIVGKLGKHVSLLAPDSFAAHCTDAFTDLPAQRNALQLYSELLFYLGQWGVGRVTFESYQPSNHQAIDDIQILAGWERDIQFGLLHHGVQPSTVPFSPPRNLGIDIDSPTLRQIVAQPDYRRPDLSNGEVWHKIVPADTTNNQQPNVDDAERIIDTLQPARLILTHTIDLERLPLPYAQAKVRQLAEITAQLRQKVGAQQ